LALNQLTEGGLAWTAGLWTGVTFVSTIVAAAIGLFAMPPVATSVDQDAPSEAWARTGAPRE
jgi:hypothetical protein